MKVLTHIFRLLLLSLVGAACWALVAVAMLGVHDLTIEVTWTLAAGVVLAYIGFLLLRQLLRAALRWHRKKQYENAQADLLRAVCS